MPTLNVGIDDTDSPRGGCTTYLCAVLIELLSKFKVKFKDYPLLIRLNPNIPFKTRGNGAVCLRFEVEREEVDAIKELILNEVTRLADLSFSGTDPGVAFLLGDVPIELRKLSEQAMYDVVSLKEAFQVVEKCGAEVYTFKEGRGIIGALAAIGETLEGDHTYELITYRVPENWGKPRAIDVESVRVMDRLTSPDTFNNIDDERVLIAPHGPDPVLYGIRGESPEVLLKAHKLVKVHEPIERWVIFRSNQGTDAHLRFKLKISDAHPHMSAVIEGVVSSKPIVSQGGHVFVKVRDDTGEINCAAYEPTGAFRWIITNLVPGDIVRVYGGIRPPSQLHPKTLNLEKIEIVKLTPILQVHNPICPSCGKRTSSAGRGQGFKCKKCGKKIFAEKVVAPLSRNITEFIYIPPPRAQRHLTRPYSRLNRKNTPPIKLLDPWHFP